MVTGNPERKDPYAKQKQDATQHSNGPRMVGFDGCKGRRRKRPNDGRSLEARHQQRRLKQGAHPDGDEPQPVSQLRVTAIMRPTSIPTGGADSAR